MQKCRQIVLLFGLAACAALHVRIATRPSPLALTQAEAISAALRLADPSVTTELVRISSSGDQSGATTQDAPLAKAPPDFVSSVDDAVLQGTADLGVHSMKDLPPSGRWRTASELLIACHLPRACPLDVLVGGGTLASLPSGARIGSASVRRQAQLLWARPDLEPVNLRGNVQARLAALAVPVSAEPNMAAKVSQSATDAPGTVAGGAERLDALVLARAGLERLGLDDDLTGAIIGDIK